MNDFLWGTSTSSYQVEGTRDCGTSIWDVFCRNTDAIIDNSSGAIACDHYHRYEEDIQLLKELGVNSYRFSLSWPRLLPNGRGKAQQKGLDFYARLIDLLLENNITPLPCLYHWDLPQALQTKGGWANRDCSGWFVDYAELVAKHLFDRVQTIALFNENNVSAWLGYLNAVFAPGIADEATAFAAAHHFNLAQGLGFQALKALNNHWQIGTVTSLSPAIASNDEPENHAAADYFDALWNKAFLDPVYKGMYPALLEDTFSRWVKTTDLKQIQQPIDFLGVNYYTPSYLQAKATANSFSFGNNCHQIATPAHKPQTDMGWEIAPTQLQAILIDLKTHYDNPTIYITENGAASDDKCRIDYLDEHIKATFKAKAAGVNVQGYFVWTFLDNFEWINGFKQHFGLVALEKDTLNRQPKPSFYWYQQRIKAG